MTPYSCDAEYPEIMVVLQFFIIMVRTF